jgi:hypothetical protein
MIRNLKVLGSLAMAVLAIGGIAAEGAAAGVEMSFTSAAEPTELTGTGGPHEWKLGEVTVKCTKSTVTGYLATKEADQMNLTPNYEGCKLNTKFGIFTAAWENFGCKTAFDSDTTPNIYTEEIELGFVNLDCGHLFNARLSAVVEKELVLLEFFDTHPKEVPVNQELLGATYSVITESPNEILIQAHTFGLKFVCKGAKCTKLGLKEGTNENGTTIGSFLVAGYSDKAHTNQVSLGLSTP